MKSELTTSRVRALTLHHGRRLATLDTIFGGFCVAMSATAGVAWLRGEGSLLAVVAILVFTLATVALSRVSSHSRSPRVIETARVALGVTVAPFAYIVGQTPCGRWWPAFLVMCLGGTTISVFLTGSRLPGRFVVALYVVLLAGTEIAVAPVVDWYALVLNGGVVAMTGLLATEMASLLAQEKARSESLLKKEAEEALRASEERFRSLVEIAGDGIILMAPDGTYRYASPGYQRMSGYSSDELIGRHFEPFVHPPDLPIAMEGFERVIREGAVQVELRTVRPDGELRTWDAVARRLPDGSLVVYCRDVTDRRQIDAALRTLIEGTGAATGGEYLKLLVGHLAKALGVKYALVAELLDGPAPSVRTLAFWAGGEIAGNVAYPLEGTPCGEVIGGSLAFHPEGLRARFPQVPMLMDLGAESYMGVPLLDGEGKVLGNLAVLDSRPMPDDTHRTAILRLFAVRAAAELQRLIAEERLRSSEQHFRSLTEYGSDVVAVLDRDGIQRYASPGVRGTLGYRPEEVLGRRWASLVHPDDLPNAMDTLRRVAEAPGEAHGVTLRVRHADGSWRVLEAVAKRRADGLVVTTSRDVTERIEAEEALRRANADLERRVTERTGELESALDESRRLTAILEATPDIVGVADMQGRMTYLNRGARRKLGFSDGEDVSHVSFRDVFAPESYERVSTVGIPYGIEHGCWSAEVAFRSRDGYEFPALLSGVVHRSADGSPSFLSGVARDVTEQKRFERELQESEARFRTLIENAPEAIVVLDADAGRFVEASPRALELFGLSPEEILRVGPLELSPPEQPDGRSSAEAARELVAKVLEGESMSVEWVHRNSRGEAFWCDVRAVRLPSAGRSLVRASITDISSRKRFEAELVRAKEAAETALVEQRRLAAIIEATSDYVGMADLEGRSVYINPAGRRMIGLAPGQTKGNIASCYPESARQKVGEMVGTALAGGVWSGEIEILHADGHAIPVSEATFALPSPDGEVHLLATIIRDITDQKRAQREIQQARDAAEAALAESRRLATILEGTTDLVGIADLSGRIVYMNGAARARLGIIGSLTDISLADVYSPESFARITQEGLPRAIATGSWSSEVTLLHQGDGHEIPVSLAGVVHRGTDGEPEYLSAVLRDISEQKRVEAELREAKEAAEAASRAKSTFLANMSHEIRTPMNAVIGMTGLLLDTPLDARQRDFVEVIRSGSDSLLTVINDILDFSKIEAGRLEIRSETFDLRSCVESAMDLLAPKAAEKKLALSYAMEGDCPEAIVGDVTRLRQVLVNLVGNAVKFTDEGEVALSARVERVEGSRRVLRFSVRDTGPGIPEERRDRLFQSFSQLDASTTREHGGTGLGLAISRRLAEMMGGAMWVESEGSPGKGSTFHFTITTEAASAPFRAHLRGPQPILAGRRVLIVDDSATNRRILRLQLQTWGMATVEASSASEALALLQRGDGLDLAILDLHMPETDGITLGAELRRLRPTVQQVLLTSVGLECKSARFEACLTKPVKPSQLHDTLVALFAERFEDLRGLGGGPIEAEPAVKAAGERIPIRILLAEDVELNRRFARSALETMGFTADVAVSGLEVLEALRRSTYDVVLMDMQMPEMDGLEATRRLRQEVPASEQPYVIAMTANAMQGDREICLAAGMDDYVSKPVYLADLRAALERAGQARGLSTTKVKPAAVVRETDPQDGVLHPCTVAELLSRPGARRMIELFETEAGETTAALDAALADGCRTGLRKAAHRLRGSSLYVGAVGLADVCRALEEAATRGASVESLGALVGHVGRELDTAVRGIRAAFVA